MTENEMMLRGIELKLDRLLLFIHEKTEKEKTSNQVEKIESEWITLTQACKLHGGYKLSTMRARLDLQPKNGKGVIIGHNKCWKREEIQEWLEAVTPEAKKAYQNKYKEAI